MTPQEEAAKAEELKAELRAALKRCPADAKPAALALLGMINRVTKVLGDLQRFALSSNAKNIERNTRLDALEARIAGLEQRRNGGA